MRKFFAVVYSVITALVGSAMAQNFAISVNPIGILFGAGDVRAEYIGAGNIGFFAGGAYGSAKGSGLSATAYGLEGGGRYYFRVSHAGPYGEAGLGFLSLTLADDSGNKATGTIFYPFALIGYRWGTEIFLDAGIGSAYYMGKVELNGSSLGAFSGTGLKTRVSLGIMF